MIVTKKALAQYLGCHINTATNKYQMYKDILDIKRKFLIISDICKIDDLTELQVKSKMYGIDNK